MSLDIGYRDAAGSFKDVTSLSPLPVRALPPSLPNAKWIQLVYVGPGVAPHGNAQRQVYTVPAGKTALVMTAWARLRRDGVATTPGYARAELGWFNNSSGTIFQQDGVTAATAGVTTFFCELMENDPNQVGMNRQVSLPGGPLFLPAGTQLFFNTFDLSTGGTIDYRCQALVLEFTA